MIPLLRRWAAKATRTIPGQSVAPVQEQARDGHTETRITIISDTHWQHEQIDLPPGDLLIHCGDMFNLFSRTPNRIAEIDAWFGRQKYDLIICTGGNHDREIEAALARQRQPLKNAHFLQDDGLAFRGLSIFGAPWVPDLQTHAFFKDRAAIARAWAKIPTAIDILVTHTPPKGILDRSSRGRSHGCAALAGELPRIAPRLHCFGHVHASAGQQKIGPTLYVNASSVESGTGNVRPPILVRLSSSPV